MLRLGTLIWMVIAIGVGLLLYNVKHEVQGLEQHLAQTNRRITEVHARIHVLHAEWSLLNEPERLRTLTDRHLDLVPMRPTQFVDATAIALLPPARPRAEPGTALAAAEPAATPQPVATRTPAAAQADARRQAEQRRPQRPAEARPEELPARLAPPREEPLAPPRAPTPRRELEAAAPRPLMPATPVAAVTGAPAATAGAPATAPPAAPAAAPASGSSLGRPAVALPPPVPFGRPQGGN
jgi:hypothetical protein